jgi:hypothetical protein
MEAPRHQGAGQEPAPPATIDAVVPGPTATFAGRSLAQSGDHTRRMRALDRSNADLADALAAFQQAIDQPASS